MKARFIGSQKVRGVKVKRQVVMGAESALHWTSDGALQNTDVIHIVMKRVQSQNVSAGEVVQIYFYVDK